MITKADWRKMGKGYSKLISKIDSKIRDIRQRSLAQISAAKDSALAEVQQDFFMLGWNKFWTKEQLNNEWQFDQLEQSVTDKSIKLIKLNEPLQSAVMEDRFGYYKVSGSKCDCGNFISTGLPCRHIYFLAGTLIELQREKKSKKPR